jgi:hypothetical protein
LTKSSNSSATSTDSYSLSASNIIRFNEEAVVRSKSNEITGSTINKSFKGSLVLTTLYSDVSPIFDLSSSVLFNNYVINNSNTNENTRYGNAACKYITKTLTLSNELEAEDIRLYLDAYKPTGTEIDVYAKIMDSSDSSTFEDKGWSKLDQISNISVFSSSLNEADVREYEYTFKRSPTSTILAGRVTSFSNTTITGTSTTFNTSLVAGDLVKIVNTSSTLDYDIIPVATVGGATSLTLAANASFSGTGLTIEKVTTLNEAFKYNRNSGIVRYYDINKSAHDGYKYLALKIVLRSNKNIIVPKVENLRAIACSV